MRGAELVIRCLENEGVMRVFGIPGEENLELIDALYESEIEFILTRHEASAAIMAGVSSRYSGMAEVCLSTLGPGATNLITGVADSLLNYQPLIVLTGQVSTDEARPPRKQYIDLVNLFRPVTKWSARAHTPSAIPQLIRKAFDVALEERPGPAHLELPENIMKAEVDGHPVSPDRHSIEFSYDALGKARDLIISSERPLILAGGGVVRGRAQKSFRNFAESWQIPVAHTWLGNGVIPFDSPLSLHTVGLRSSDFMLRAFRAADLIILAGYDPSEFQPRFWNIGEKKAVIYIGAAPMENVRGLSPDVELIGDLNKILGDLSLSTMPKEPWAEDLRRTLHSMIIAQYGDDSDRVPLKPGAVVRAIRKTLDREDIAVSDVGAHLLWMMKFYPTFRENTLICSNGLIPMGFGVPAAIAAKLNRPEKRVILACGDGGFMMSSAELETAVRLGTPFVTVVFNDPGLGLIRSKQQARYGRSYGVDFGNPDFVKYAEAFGAEGIRISSIAELEEELKRCVREDLLAVIDVTVDYSYNEGLTR